MIIAYFAKTRLKKAAFLFRQSFTRKNGFHLSIAFALPTLILFAQPDFSSGAEQQNASHMTTATYELSEETIYADELKHAKYVSGPDRFYFRWPDQERIETVRASATSQPSESIKVVNVNNPTGYQGTQLTYRDGSLDEIRNYVTVGRTDGLQFVDLSLLSAVYKMNLDDFTRIGEEQIDGEKLIRYEAKPNAVQKSSPEAHLVTTVWVNPVTSRPVRISSSFHPLAVNGVKERVLNFTELRFDNAIPDELFEAKDFNRLKTVLSKQLVIILSAKGPGNKIAGIKISGSNGDVLATEADFPLPADGSGDRPSLTPDAADRIAKYSTANIGGSIAIEIAGKKQIVTIYGPVKLLIL